ncbi:hydrogenase nickel incorporation protein HypB [Marinisporobacter balticus]|uniref:Hydrogenase nickel incorporation protein HypB n=1 Tax=Marinisporobacter balticus TaxID=2018667 RepID=A0A4R2KPQ4_9FIRM|nr:hydrogenase nickel incorporation protein HypB [Marinisporobacter balticus]TCO74627.1 hydrogenase nickel incorporation protein HypB [Marinisporobacter balticus]
MKQILIQKNILKNNDAIAIKNRKILNEQGVFTINLLGSPGSGKTSILEQIIKHTKEKVNMAVIEGDLYTTKDAQRIQKHLVDVVQVNTGGACHLDASMVEQALEHIDMSDLDFLVIENVGNLVCPAAYDLSEDIKITVMSVTEGNDKPLKYPSMFQRSKAIILNKIDMIGLTDFDMEMFYKDIASLNDDIKIFEVSCREEEGIEELCKYLKCQINHKGGKLL